MDIVIIRCIMGGASIIFLITAWLIARGGKQMPWRGHLFCIFMALHFVTFLGGPPGLLFVRAKSALPLFHIGWNHLIVFGIPVSFLLLDLSMVVENRLKATGRGTRHAAKVLEDAAVLIGPSLLAIGIAWWIVESIWM